ncbi:GNAT family N-acetyltransferase [Acetobacteraceae bacterium KSS8]|uniref:GNAT family N-acetyltransferase n=1 Tax=Endosaccharibacter trunci TaxID=2812733 RepID=A0ABT1W736_9PROT|nr:GNAT family N-acetyltransferase [Acetobacteraceae bacterium KSS8]
MRFRTRWAVTADIPRIDTLMRLAIDRLQDAFLSPEQVVASRAFMGLDTQLVTDGTYLLAETETGELAGCGGWSFRATLYGGDHTAAQRDPALLDPATAPARIRAMYTHPGFARRGVGRLILETCERAAAERGFREAEMMATLSGEPLYRACGYQPVERSEAVADGVAVPLIRMRRPLGAS